jgi:progressive ankylosis protein
VSALSAKKPSEAVALSHREILRFYLPLAFSWLFMAIEGPISIGVISRMPQPQINTAAFLIMISLALWIESPVIDLLSTATTLGKNRQHYAVLSRFTLYVMAGVTAVHATVALTPLYWLITTSLLSVPQPVAEAARIGMIIMIPWSAFIGWRRYLQGILIRYGRTRLIGIGTTLRVLSVIVTALVLFLTTNLPGISIAAGALVISVAAEALFAHVVSRDVIRKEFLLGDGAPPETPLTMRKLFSFHMPLTMTTMVMLMGGPVVSAALARTPDSVLALASWQVAITLMFMMRTVVFALPEVVITLYRDAETARKLRAFCFRVGVVTSGILLTLALSGLDQVFFRDVLQAREETVRMAHLGFFAGALMPFIGAMQSYVRGMLTAHHLTAARLFAVLVSMACLFLALAIGLRLQITGVVMAALAITFALAAELAALVWVWRRGARRLGLSGWER